jgi:hypothetical protein
VALGALVTAGHALQQHWQVVVPLTGVASGVAAALCLGGRRGSTRRSAPPAWPPPTPSAPRDARGAHHPTN